MTIMYKRFVGVVFLSVVLPAVTHAQLVAPRGTNLPEDSFAQKAADGSFITAQLFGISKTIFLLLFTLFIAVTVYALVLHFTLGADVERLERAKRWVRNAFIGALIMFVVTVLLYFFDGFLR